MNPQKRAYPIQKMASVNEMESGDKERDIEGMMKNDPFCYAWSLKAKSKETRPTMEDGVIKPIKTFVGVDPENNNSFSQSFFLAPYVHQTPNWRFRRSVFRAGGTTHHYLHGVMVTGQDQFSRVRFELGDLNGLKCAIEDAIAEIEAYTSNKN